MKVNFHLGRNVKKHDLNGSAGKADGSCAQYNDYICGYII